jgi:hypothetical protein
LRFGSVEADLQAAIRLGRLHKTRDVGRETITATRYVDDVTDAVLPIAKRATKRRDVDPNVGFFDNGVGPYQPGKLSLVDDLTRAFDQDLQNSQSAASQGQRTIVFEQQPSRGHQPKGPKAYDLVRFVSYIKDAAPSRRKECKRNISYVNGNTKLSSTQDRLV